jgi:signal transduction histidine kinase
MIDTGMDITITILAGMLVLLLFFVFLLYTLLAHQKRKLLYAQELQHLKEGFNREILKSQLEIKEQTLLNISQEIHDNIGQLLSLANLNLSAIEAPENSEIDTRLNRAMELVSRSLETLRNLSKTMDADNIAQLGLAELLKLELNMIEKTGKYTTSLTVEGMPQQLDHSKEIIAYRILQETITNIVKHAKATAIHINLHYCNSRFLVTIKDNGIGFIINKSTGSNNGAGMRNMMNRSKLINSDFFVNSEPKKGTMITLSIPLTA